MKKKYFYLILFYFLASPIIVFAAQEGNTPPAPLQRAGAPPVGLPIDGWISVILIGAAFVGSYYIHKNRKRIS